MNELYHYGVQGMKWGIRRYQNKDGTLTEEGKSHNRFNRRLKQTSKTSEQVKSIIASMNKDQRKRLELDDDEEYLPGELGGSVIKRVIEKDGDIPVSFFDMMLDEDAVNVTIGTRTDYAGRGYATKAAKKGLDWYENNKSKFDDKPVQWGVMKDNEASIKIAKKIGFTEDPSSQNKDWTTYIKR